MPFLGSLNGQREKKTTREGLRQVLLQVLQLLGDRTDDLADGGDLGLVQIVVLQQPANDTHRIIDLVA